MRGSVGSPKRSASRTAIGRAPMVKMSRRIPPTPVAAPWYGSTADGWLWLSILKATASPSPMRTTPALSPGPAIMPLPRVGRVLRSGLELLYEQCSLHITLNMASSTWLGSRPSFSRITVELVVGDAELAVQRLRLLGLFRGGRDRRHVAHHRASALGGAVAAGRPAASHSARALDERADQLHAVVAAQDRLGHPLRMRHQPGHVAGRVADAGDGPQRAVGVGRIVGIERRSRRPRGRTGTGPGRRARARPASPRRRSSSPRRGRSGCGSAAPVAARVNGESRRSGLMPTSRQANRSERLRSSAPGTRPASARTWKPLQMPRTWPPAAAKSETPRITGEKRAMTPARM